MNEDIEVQLSPRIQKHCLRLWQDEHYKHAAREAVIQVELALKEKGMVQDGRYGKYLIDTLFTLGGKHKTIKLRVPLGDALQGDAKKYFEGVFGYYRNYLAHDGSKVDKTIGLRILVVASELLDLIDASSLSYADLGGIDGLLESGLFDSEKQLLGVLECCHEYMLVGHDSSGLVLDLFSDYGAEYEQFYAVFELDLVRYTDTKWIDPLYGEEEGGWLELTELGKKFVHELQKRRSRSL
jgi:hypothetical protein